MHQKVTLLWLSPVFHSSRFAMLHNVGFPSVKIPIEPTETLRRGALSNLKNGYIYKAYRSLLSETPEYTFRCRASFAGFMQLHSCVISALV